MSPIKRTPVNPNPHNRRHFEHPVTVNPLGSNYYRPKKKLSHSTKYVGWLQSALRRLAG